MNNSTIIKYVSLILLFISYNTDIKAQNDDFYLKLSDAAIKLTSNKVFYAPAYFTIKYPNGDVPANKGVCTDVIIRAYRLMNIDLQKEIHVDMKANFEKYPSRKKWGLKTTDTNIDHRRVPNQQTFFARKGTSLPISDKASDYKPGDIVSWDLGNGLTHIGIVVNRKKHNSSRYMIVHNIGQGQVLEDCLFSWKITGHYKYQEIRLILKNIMEHYAIYLNTVLPVRATPDERSEMVTQLLFGQTCKIIESSDSFSKICDSDDGYEGWVDTKMLTTISKAEYEATLSAPIFRICVPLADAFCLTNKMVYHLSAGSKLPNYNPETNSIDIAGLKFQIHSSLVSYISHQSIENIASTSKLFLNTPYLWGGKNILGIDCSGFTQVVFSLCGYNLLRDASLQNTQGIAIPSLNEAEAGDLLFFDKKGRITHVGIYLGNNQLIHASGKVRIDTIDTKGVFNNDIQDYTHSLISIRRL